MKKVAILGRPNVGKSSLFNRLARQRDAITSDISGTTRDVKKRVVTINGNREFEVIDTGGIDYTSELFSKVAELSLKAATNSDIIVYMVDGKNLPDDEDKRLFYSLQKQGKPIALVVNKIDNDKERDGKLWEFLDFGSENTFGISVSHNREMNQFYAWLEQYIEPKEQEAVLDINEEFDPLFDDEPSSHFNDEVDDKHIKVAIIGRVNTGKSSLLNALLGEERTIVSDVAGTTIDPIDEEMEYGEYKFTFIDTAGIRRRSKILGIEKFALTRTEEMLKQANIVLLVIDAVAGISELDERVAGMIEKHKLACLIVLNKWDIKGDKTYEEVQAHVRHKLKFLHYAPFITISAKTGMRVHKLTEEIIKIYDRYTTRIPTSQLNDILNEAIRRHHVPSHNGAVVRIKFATQYETKPPKIALIANRPELVHFSYIRYLANFFRSKIDFEGVPLDIVARKRGERLDIDDDE